MGVVDAAVELSIVVPSYQRRASLVRLLRSLAAALEHDDPVEVVVVLDGSTDGSAEALASLDLGLGSRFRWIEQANRGPAGARNAGIRAAAGRFCLLVDDDVTLERSAIETHLDLQRRAGAPTVVLGPLWEPGPTDGGPSAGLRAFVAARNQRLIEQGMVADPFDFWTGVMSAPRQTLLDLDGFDEGFQGWGEEDVEFGFRVIGAGIPVRFVAEAGATHHRERRPGQAIAAQRQRGRNLVRLCELHPEALGRVNLATSPVVSAFELGLRSPRAYGSVAEAVRLALRLRPVRASRFRQPLFRTGCDANLLAGALDRDASTTLLRRLTVRDRSFAADVQPPSWPAAVNGAGGTNDAGGTGPTGDDQATALAVEYQELGLIRSCGRLADPSVIADVVAEADWFTDAVAELDRQGERRVPYRFGPAIQTLAADPAMVATVEAVLGTDRWVAWGANIQIGTPNQADEWHTDVESDLWPTITVAVGLRGCGEGNATRYLPGTHRFSSSPLALSDPNDDQLVLATARQLDPACDSIVRFDGFGDGAFYLFDGRGWHCGDVEPSADRLSLFLHYQRADDLRIPYMRDYRRGRWFETAAPYWPNPVMGDDYERRVHRPPPPPRPWDGRRLRPALKRVRRRARTLARRP